MLLVNTCSIVNKMDEFESYVYALKPDLVMITNSLAREDIIDAELSIVGFFIFCNDRELYVGGFCILYVNNCYNVTLVEDLTNVPDNERVWCKLMLSNMSILIIVCYYTTSATVINEIVLHNTIRKACSMNDYVIIILVISITVQMIGIPDIRGGQPCQQ